MLRTEPGRGPHGKGLSNLIGELSTRSENFPHLVGGHNVRFRRTGVKRFRHPVIGDLTLTFEALDLAAGSACGFPPTPSSPAPPPTMPSRFLPPGPPPSTRPPQPRRLTVAEHAFVSG